MIKELNNLTPYIRQIKKYTSTGSPTGYIDPDHSITLITEGGGNIVLEGIEYQVRCGDILFFPPYLHHIIKPATTMKQIIVHFDPVYEQPREGRKIYLEHLYGSLTDFLDNSASTLEKYLAQKPLVISLDDFTANSLKERLLPGLQQFRDKQPFHQVYLKSLVIELIHLLCTKSEQPPERRKFETKQWEKLEQVLAYIHKNYKQPIPLETAAELAQVTKTYFSRLFKEYVGINFHHYLMQTRIESAKILISENSFNFSEIARETGFANVHHFSRTFSKYAGCSPTQYKKSVLF